MPSSMTVTATQGGSTGNGILLRVVVLAGAASTQNGATASANAAVSTSITTTVTNSRVYGAAVAGSGSYTPNGSTTQFDNVADGVNGEQYLTFKATALTGTPGAVTIGDNTGGNGVALAEILPAANTLTEDGSAPPVVSTTAATTVTTASFTPPGNSLLVALVSSDGGGSQTTMTVSGGGLTWTPLAAANTAGSDYAGVWIAQAAPPAPGDPVITATQGGSTANGLALRIFVLTQAKPVAQQPGGTNSTQFAPGTATYTASVTTTVTGSRVYGASSHGNSAATAAAATTVIDDITDATNGERYTTFKATSLTGTPGATTLGFTLAAGQGGPFCMAEILSAGTLTEDASAPAVASTTTSTFVSCTNFTPPPGSLLVALVGSDGGGAVTTMTVSGGGLNWTEAVKNNPTGGDYAGVWVADVPAAAGAGFISWYAPAYQPGFVPGAGAVPFAAWPQYEAGAALGAAADVLNAAATVTATITASLTSAPAPYLLPPPVPPAWFPAAPSAPGAEPFTAWPVQAGATAKSDVLAAATTVTATGAAALNEAKPLNAASTITATGAAAETTSKPLNAAAITTATAAASLTVVKAGVTPAPLYPPAWFPSAPAVPGGQPYAPWPVWQGAGASAAPGPDLLNAAATITATAAAVLTEAKPVNASSAVTATIAAALTTSKPLNAAQTVTATGAAALSDSKAGQELPLQYAPGWFPGAPGFPAGEPFAPWPAWQGAGASATPVDALTAAATITATAAAALTEAKPLNAATTVTAAQSAALTEAKPLTATITVTAAQGAGLDAVKAGTAPAPVFTPAWFPGAPGVPAAEAFAPWPPWTGAPAAAAPPAVNAASAPRVSDPDTSAAVVAEANAILAAVSELASTSSSVSDG